MPDQKRNNGERTSDRASGADPLGADATLRATQVNDQAQSSDALGSAQAAVTSPSAGTGATERTSMPRDGEAPWQADQQRQAGGAGTRMMASAGAVGGSAVHATRDVLRGAIGATEDVASDLVGGVTHVAAELVHGVRDVGYEVRDGATGLIGAAGSIGGSAVHTVADLLVDVVGGVRHVIGAAMGHDGNAAMRANDNGGIRQAPSPAGSTDPGDFPTMTPQGSRGSHAASSMNP